MANLTQYRQQVGLQPPSRPQATHKDYVAPALEQVGSKIAAIGGAMIEREERRKAFEDNTNYRRMEAGLNTALFEAGNNMGEGGGGFTDGFMGGDFKAATEAYLAGIDDDDLRARREADISVLAEQYRLRAARAEQGELVRFQTTELTQLGEEAAVRISADPSEENVQREMDLIEAAVRSSNLPRINQGVLIDAAQTAGARAYLKALEDVDPLRAFHETGGRTADLPTATQAGYITTALEEYWPGNGDPRETTRVGALGMREDDAMRALAADGVDTSAEGPGDWRSMLTNPATARFYANQRLEELMDGGRGIEDAIVGFYMGEEFADGEWTRGDLPRRVQTALRNALPVVNGTAPTGGSTIPITDGNGNPHDPSRYANINPELISTAQRVFSMFGFTELPVSSMERPSGSGTGAGSGSQHIVFVKDAHGNVVERRDGALDISIAQLSIPQRQELLKALSAANITGLGIYGSFIHVDMGSRRSWNGHTDANGNWVHDPVPSWATEIAAKHNRGEWTWDDVNQPGITPFVMAAGATTVNATRQGAETVLTGNVTPTPQQREFASQNLTSYVQHVEATGQPPIGYDPEDDLSILTPSAANNVREDIEVAHRVASLTDEIETLSAQELEHRRQLTLPQEDRPVTAADERVEAEVEEQIKEVERERADDPAQAAFNYPEVDEAMQAINAAVAGSQPITPELMQNYIRANLRVQREEFLFGSASNTARPMPVWKAHALDVAGYIAAVTRSDATPDGKEALFRQLYATAQTFYGEYADEVLLQAMMTLRGSEGTAARPGPEQYYIDQMRNVADGGSTRLEGGDGALNLLEFMQENFDDNGNPLPFDPAGKAAGSAPPPSATPVDRGTHTVENAPPSALAQRGVSIARTLSEEDLARFLADMDRSNPEVAAAVRAALGL